MLPARISEADLMFWAVTGDVFDAGGLKAWRTMVRAKEMSAWRMRGMSKIWIIVGLRRRELLKFTFSATADPDAEWH